MLILYKQHKYFIVAKMISLPELIYLHTMKIQYVYKYCLLFKMISSGGVHSLVLCDYHVEFDCASYVDSEILYRHKKCRLIVVI